MSVIDVERSELIISSNITGREYFNQGFNLLCRSNVFFEVDEKTHLISVNPFQYLFLCIYNCLSSPENNYFAKMFSGKRVTMLHDSDNCCVSVVSGILQKTLDGNGIDEAEARRVAAYILDTVSRDKATQEINAAIPTPDDPEDSDEKIFNQHLDKNNLRKAMELLNKTEDSGWLDAGRKRLVDKYEKTDEMEESYVSYAIQAAQGVQDDDEKENLIQRIVTKYLAEFGFEVTAKNFHQDDVLTDNPFQRYCYKFVEDHKSNVHSLAEFINNLAKTDLCEQLATELYNDGVNNFINENNYDLAMELANRAEDGEQRNTLVALVQEEKRKSEERESGEDVDKDSVGSDTDKPITPPIVIVDDVDDADDADEHGGQDKDKPAESVKDERRPKPPPGLPPQKKAHKKSRRASKKRRPSNAAHATSATVVLPAAAPAVASSPAAHAQRGEGEGEGKSEGKGEDGAKTSASPAASFYE